MIHRCLTVVPYHCPHQNEIIRRAKKALKLRGDAHLCGVTMACEEQDRLLQELRSAVTQHAELVERVVLMIRSGERREGLHGLFINTAEAKSKCASLQEKLNRHRAEHGC